MEIKTWIKYMEEYYPPRCRKPRFEEKEAFVNITLKEINRSDVRLAYKVNDNVYYEYNNQLYNLATARDISNFDIDDPIENLKYCNEHCSTYFGFEPYNTLTEMKIKAHKDMKSYILINGVLYKRCGVPMYELCVFGMGNNHGGTSLMISEKSIPNEYTFSASERIKAIDEAISTALKRGDTESINCIKKCSVIEAY